MDEQVKALVKNVVDLIEVSLKIQPSECIKKNMDAISKNSLAALKMLIPEISKAVDELAPKFMEIQSARITGSLSVETYIDSIMKIFSTYNVDPGIWAAFTALQAMYAIQSCGNDAAKYFLLRTILAGSIPFNLYVAMLNYVGVDNQFGLELFRSLLSQARNQ